MFIGSFYTIIVYLNLSDQMSAPPAPPAQAPPAQPAPPAQAPPAAAPLPLGPSTPPTSPGPTKPPNVKVAREEAKAEFRRRQLF